MRCPGCDRGLKGQKTTLEQPYQYVESGLAHVFLVGVTLYTCQCGEELVEIPKVEQLDGVIAKALIQKIDPLSGAEVRFLRKYAELPAKDFAKILGKAPNISLGLRIRRFSEPEQPTSLERQRTSSRA